MTRILLLGASGMLGSTLFRYLSGVADVRVIGTIRAQGLPTGCRPEFGHNIVSSFNALDHDSLTQLLLDVKPDLLINCIGVIKQRPEARDVLHTIPLNTLLPHRLAQLVQLLGIRLVHFSTDCVFSGAKGLYTESDPPDAQDLYGQSKKLGEVTSPGCLTIRTSIIGHELNSQRSLLNWFLAQKGPISGYARAIFSGLPTIEVAHVMHEHIIPNERLSGLFHLSAEPISKLELLRKVASVYGKDVAILPSQDVVIDRSLDSKLFREHTGYKPPDWDTLLKKMHNYG